MKRSESQQNASAADYQRMIAEISQLAGGLAHELRNPLSTMMINLKLLAEDLRDARAHPDDVHRRALLKVETLLREGERLHHLFDQFLSLTGPYRLTKVETDLNQVIARLVEFVGPAASSKNIEVMVTPARTPLPCRVDERLLEQALLNIVVNAQEAMPSGGRLTIATAREGRHATIAFSDTGVGISREDRDRIVKPFFSTKEKGTGLGLSVTQRILSEHGGTLSFESRAGQGTTCTIRLPCDDPPLPETENRVG